jgi:hypothetical protein
MKNLRSYLLENMEELRFLVDVINSYNGSLNYLEVYENDKDFFEVYFTNTFDAVRSVYYGDYNFHDDLIRFNGLGNIESLSNYDYEIELRDSIDDIIDELLKVYNELDISDELYELIENILNEEE